MLGNDPKELHWHSLQAVDVITKFETDERGLDSHQVRTRRQKYGHNIIPNIEQRSTVQILLLQFKNLPIILLVTASILSYFLGRGLEAIAILAVVFMTVGFGFFMERSAEQAIGSLVNLRSPKAKVLRDNRETEIKAHNIVPGDIVEFKSGDKVPADCRLLETFGLVIDESPLTGEPHGVRKDDDIVLEQSLGLADRTNMSYMGTLVLEGHAKGLVTAIGKQTEIGKVGELLQGVSSGKTPLEYKIENLGKLLVVVVFAITVLYIAIGYLQGFNIGNIILSGIVLAIAAVPEGLPAVVTITLAIGVKRMAKKHALIRRLASAETLGSVTVICTDKTGTLTKNEPTVREIVVGTSKSINSVTGAGFNPTGGKLLRDGKEVNLKTEQDSDLVMLLKAVILCNNSELSFDGKEWNTQGDTTEAALVVVAAKGRIEKRLVEKDFERIWEDPFDSKTRKMTTIHRDKDGKIFAFIKGAPESIPSICSKVRENRDLVDLDVNRLRNIHKRVNEMTAKSYRLLVVAYRELNGVKYNQDNYHDSIARDWILLGIVGIYDPPRPEVKNAIEFIREAKIRVILITGDHPVTARAVASELEISGGKCSSTDKDNLVVTGAELEKMSVGMLAESIGTISVFARATPEHKLKIVEALQRRGEIVAMTGDGVNDAPALKQADIGIAMGKKGTDVAKESAELILLDDNFATITHAIELGRLIFTNIKKFVQYLFSCNISEVMTMLVAIVMALPFPLLPLQLLWMNLTINTFPALAIAAEKGNGQNKFVRHLTSAAIAVFLWALSTEELHSAAQTLAFSTLSLAQTWHVLNYSSTLKRIFGKSNAINKPLIGAIVLSLGLLVITMYTMPLSDILELYPLNLIEWVIAIVISAISIIAASITMRILGSKK
jgi:Ca2+-transporting ATPase